MTAKKETVAILFSEPKFVVPFTSKWGDTIECADPKREAYKQMAVIAFGGNRPVGRWNDDGTVTVTTPGLTDITFAPLNYQKEHENEAVN